ncbi:hypothetical protein ONS95_000181 [Cadophora gregata]|uniref:uncharacterized protein n=1 Tax=Cadophora gregata TaxID=51156 RepID=UPI0026DAA9F3|nr:uncharacterized protein ONS95_000181 [Cadophora gregata]KAK0115542.1 hypothetical protein ONS96_013995 [Cadophora gregata f. sp. sojae]KAK0128203.1 hypothetical protein ONS95_000181 [Cadophora gregata]
MSSFNAPSKLTSMAKVTRYISDPLKIIVGPQAEDFLINEEVICKQSQFFKTTCRTLWQSGRARTVTLLDDDPTIFAIFLSWLITGDIESSDGFNQVTAPPYAEAHTIEQRYAQWEQLRRCYTLGDDLLAPGFQNAIIDCLIAVSSCLIMNHNMFPCRTSQELEIIYETTYPGSGLRKLVVDLAVKCMGVESLENLDLIVETVLGGIPFGDTGSCVYSAEGLE